MLKTEQTLQSATVNAANSAADERPFSAARRLKTCLRSTIMKREESREQTNFAFLANGFVGCSDHRILYVMIEKAQVCKVSRC